MLTLIMDDHPWLSRDARCAFLAMFACVREELKPVNGQVAVELGFRMGRDSAGTTNSEVTEYNEVGVMLRPTASYLDMFRTFTHELVHVEQTLRGSFVSDKTGMVFDGKRFSFKEMLPLLDDLKAGSKALPWEAEAYARTPGLYKRAMDRLPKWARKIVAEHDAPVSVALRMKDRIATTMMQEVAEASFTIAARDALRRGWLGDPRIDAALERADKIRNEFSANFQRALEN